MSEQLPVVIDQDEFQVPTIQPVGVIMPAAPPSELVAAMRAYEETRAALMTKDDYQQTRNGESFPKKSYFTKLSIAYAASCRIKEGYPILHYDEDGNLLRAECIAVATAPNGRTSEGYGACSVREPRYTHQYDDTKNKTPRYRAGDPISSARQKLEHDLPSTAETRSKNRAYSGLFGYSGEVSWDEVTASGDDDMPFEGTPTQANLPPASPNRLASGNQLATIAHLSRLLGSPEQPDDDMTSAEASERIGELQRLYNERKGQPKGQYADQKRRGPLPAEATAQKVNALRDRLREVAKEYGQQEGQGRFALDVVEDTARELKIDFTGVEHLSVAEMERLGKAIKEKEHAIVRI